MSRQRQRSSAAKEHATYAACQVPSQSKFIKINRHLLRPYMESILPRY